MNEAKIGFLSDKGFGFLTIEGRAKDLFFHSKALVGVAFEDLKVGDPVTFEDIGGTNKGDAAIGVRLAA